MKTFYKSLLLLMTLALPLTGSFAQPTLEAVVDYDALAKQCTALAVQLNALSRAQDRKECVLNFDGLNVYYAGNYISFRWINKAIDVLIAGIIQVQYARDIDCYFKDEIQEVIIKLISIKDELLE